MVRSVETGGLVCGFGDIGGLTVQRNVIQRPRFRFAQRLSVKIVCDFDFALLFGGAQGTNHALCTKFSLCSKPTLISTTDNYHAVFRQFQQLCARIFR